MQNIDFEKYAMKHILNPMHRNAWQGKTQKQFIPKAENISENKRCILFLNKVKSLIKVKSYSFQQKKKKEYTRLI